MTIPSFILNGQQQPQQVYAHPALIQAARQGDMGAYARLVELFNDMAYALAYGLLGNEHAAQDVVQEAFVAAYRELPRLKSPEAFPVWLRRVIFNRCDLLLRRRKVKIDPSRDVGDLPAAEGAPSVRRMETREAFTAMLAALRGLPPGYRKTVTLHYFGGYSVKEVARLLRINEGAVKRRLCKGRAWMERRLRGGEGGAVGLRHGKSMGAAGAGLAQLRVAIDLKDIRAIKRLVVADPSLIDAVRASLKMPLLFCAAMMETYRALGLCDLLLALGADYDVHSAAVRGQAGVVGRLLDDRPALLEERQYLNLTPLHSAARGPDERVASLLVDRGADPNVVSRNGWTPMHGAAANGNVRIIRALAERGADVRRATTDGVTPLHMAAYHGKVGAVRRLLKEYGQPYDIHVAAAIGDAQGVQRILDHDPALADARLRGITTPISLAATNGHAAVGRLLMARGATLDVISASLLGWDEQISGLLRRDPGLANREEGPLGYYPLHFAVMRDDLPLLRLLLDHGADTGVKDQARFHDTPLAWAETYFKLEAADILRPHTGIF